LPRHRPPPRPPPRPPHRRRDPAQTPADPSSNAALTPGALTLFGREPARHRLLAEHLTSEYRVRTEGRGRSVDEWKLRAEKAENHWLDCLVGAAVAASMEGCAPPGIEPLRERPRERVSFAAMQARARARTYAGGHL
ncbi:MAG: hypothetical protein WD749_00955, partial [Phycisphaerales bacterium]